MTVDLMGGAMIEFRWTFSKHALERALDMAVDAKELRDTLLHPIDVRRSEKYPHAVVYSSRRISLPVDPEGNVITVLWYRFNDGDNHERFDRDNDLDRIRDQ